MKDRLALVTGGMGAIGTEICAQLAGRGYRVTAVDLNPDTEAVAAWQATLQEQGHDVAYEQADVSDFESCAALEQTVERKYGLTQVLVNAAGITRDSTLRKMTPLQWSEVLRVNLDSVFNMCRQFIDPMVESGFGRVVNIASVNGQRGQFGQTNYSAAKAGMHGFTMALARETAAKGITVNSVSPGYVKTPLVDAIPDRIRERIIQQIPVGRLATPAEVARVVCFLVDDESAYITGANIPVNGGYRISV